MFVLEQNIYICIINSADAFPICGFNLELS